MKKIIILIIVSLIFITMTVYSNEKDVTLIYYSRSGTTADLRKALKNGININHITKNGETALVTAIEYNKLDNVMYLISQGADVNIVGTYSGYSRSHLPITPIGLAVEKYSIYSDEKYLYGYNEEPEIPYMKERQSTYLKIIKYLLAKGVKLNIPNNPPLNIAIKYGTFDIVKLLIENKANVNYNNLDNTPLMEAVYYARFDIVKYLVLHGADVNLTGSCDSTALSEAATMFYIKDYIFRDSEIRETKLTEEEKKTIKELKMTYFEIVKYLISKGVNVNHHVSDGTTPLMIAARHQPEYGNFKIVKYLVDKGSKINAKDNYGNTALGHAVAVSWLEVVEFLIEKGAFVNAKNKRNESLLANAVFIGKKNIIKLLVLKGADLNSQDDDGNTPLIIAVSTGDIDIIKFLINSGSDPFVKNKKNETALDFAEKNKFKDIVEYIKLKMKDKIKYHK